MGSAVVGPVTCCSPQLAANAIAAIAPPAISRRVGMCAVNFGRRCIIALRGVSGDQTGRLAVRVFLFERHRQASISGRGYARRWMGKDQ